MKKILLVIYLMSIFVVGLAAKETLRLSNGKEIIINDDFTWEYAEIVEVPTDIHLTRDWSMSKYIDSENGAYRIYYDPEKWHQLKNIEMVQTDAEVMIENHLKTGYGMLIYEGLEIPINSLKEIIISNLSFFDSDTSITSAVTCNINGTIGELITYDIHNMGLDLSYLSFITSKPTGTIQFTFYTLQSSFNKLRQSFIDALAGLVF